MNPGFGQGGRGRGRGRGFGGGRNGGGGGGGGGRGWRNRQWAMDQPGWARTGSYDTPGLAPISLAREQETEILRARAQSLQSTLADTQSRLEELEGTRGEKE
jgi:hypothetical protein